MIKFESSNDIQKWLVEQLSSLLRVPKKELDLDAPLKRYGLDSMDAVTLVMDVEQQLGMELPPSFFWEYPTVRECVSYLSTTLKVTVSPLNDGAALAS
jgi:acyl carrier protein